MDPTLLIKRVPRLIICFFTGFLWNLCGIQVFVCNIACDSGVSSNTYFQKLPKGSFISKTFQLISFKIIIIRSRCTKISFYEATFDALTLIIAVVNFCYFWVYNILSFLSCPFVDLFVDNILCTCSYIFLCVFFFSIIIVANNKNSKMEVMVSIPSGTGTMHTTKMDSLGY